MFSQTHAGLSEFPLQTGHMHLGFLLLYSAWLFFHLASSNTSELELRCAFHHYWGSVWGTEYYRGKTTSNVIIQILKAEVMEKSPIMVCTRSREILLYGFCLFLLFKGFFFLKWQEEAESEDLSMCWTFFFRNGSTYLRGLCELEIHLFAFLLQLRWE